MPSFPTRGHTYDVIVVGAGIAGSEAALACARHGLDTLLVTTSLDTVYNLAQERVTLDPPDGTLMQALWQRCADDDGRVASWDLHRAAKQALEHQDGLHLLQSNVTALRLDDEGNVAGVETWEGVPRNAPSVALCAGSFLRARLTVGSLTEEAGRLSEMAYDDLYLDLEARGVGFREATLTADPEAGSPAYQVRCRVIDPASLGPDGTRVRDVPGLTAAGLCARGYLPYAEAALDGVRLARALLDVAAA